MCCFLTEAIFVWERLYNMSLLSLCLFVGLIGGTVYVNTYTLLSKEIERETRAFALAATSVGDSFGIACADIVSILIQGCLYRVHGIPGAAFKCQ